VKTNRFSKALRHLKSTELDEKIQRLQEAPTNNIGGVYANNRGGFRLGERDPERIFYPDVDGNWPDGIPGTPGEKTYTRPAGYWDSGPGSVPAVDWDVKVDLRHSGTSTDGFINPTDGTVLVDLPPDSRDFILGPLVDGYTYNHGYDDYTNIGYIQKDTRQFILLGRIQGYWKDGAEGSVGAGRNPVREWGGESDGFTSYNENFTLAMAQWFRDQYNAGTYAKNVSYFYSGGQPQTGNPDTDAPDGSLGGVLPGTRGGGQDPYGIGGDPNSGTDQDDPNPADPEEMGFPWGLIQKVKDVFSKILQGPEAFFPKGTLIGDAIQDALQGGVKNSLEYNALLPVYLGMSILTGQKLEIPIAPSAAKDMVRKIDPNALSNVLTINTPTPTTARETVKPSSGKSDAVIKDSAIGWGAQGGLNFNYNSETGELEVTSNKTLRTTSGGETVTTADKFGGMASPGKITSFSDIPTPTTSQVQDAATKLISAVSTKLGGPGLSPDIDLDTQLKLMRDNYNSNDISRVATELGLNISKTMTQGAASNIVALRKVLVDNGIVPKSDVEKIGGAHGQVSNTYKVPYEDLPKDVKKVIDQKIGVKESKEVLTESRRRILREVKRPYSLPEYPKQKLKKYKPNFAGKYSPQNTPDVTACKESDNIAKAKNAAGQTWRTSDKHWSRYQSTERMNVVFDQVGHGDQYWEMIIDDNKNKKKIRDRKVQEHLNILCHERAMLKENPNFKSPFRENLKEQETIDAPNDPLFNRVSKKLKTVIDYPDKPSPNGYPNDLPPQQVNGWHQDYGKRDGYYNKLDPQSAEAMPPTGNPDIDAKVQKARRIKQMAKKRA
jgi:hypothetical protein